LSDARSNARRDPDAHTRGAGNGHHRDTRGLRRTCSVRANASRRVRSDFAAHHAPHSRAARAPCLLLLLSRADERLSVMESELTGSKTYRTGTSSRHIKTAPECFKRDARQGAGSGGADAHSWWWARKLTMRRPAHAEEEESLSMGLERRILRPACPLSSGRARWGEEFRADPSGG